MEDAVTRSREMLEAMEPGSFGAYVAMAVERGGVVHLDPSCVFLGIPFDPVDADHEHTFYVLFCGGECLAAGAQAQYLLGLGYTHVVWAREMREKGRHGPRKHSLERASRLAQIMNR